MRKENAKVKNSMPEVATKKRVERAKCQKQMASLVAVASDRIPSSPRKKTTTFQRAKKRRLVLKSRRDCELVGNGVVKSSPIGATLEPTHL